VKKNERNGQRKFRTIGSRSKDPDLGYYLIVTDTKETERNYIKGLKESIPEELRRRLVIKVTQTETKDLVNETLNLAALQPQYSEPWIIFDRDQVKNFDDIIKKAENSGIKVAWSNPCIEIWFSTYFNEMPVSQTSTACCSDFSKIFKDKVKQRYLKSDDKIYHKLYKYGNEELAIKLAENKLKEQVRNEVKKYSEMCPATTVHRLIKDIREKIEKNEI